MATDPFEQKFGILADSTLSNQLPEMKDFSIGFQVVDTEDDNSRAFGVQLYNIGKHLVMVPMFWLKGKIKGGEVMYVKDLNRFMPFTEGDVNNLKTGKTFSMGDVDGERDKSDGNAYSVSAMELNWLNTKRAGEVTLIDKRDIAAMLSNCGEFHLPEFSDIRMFGPKAAADMVATMKDNPSFTNNLLRFHTPEEITDALMPGLRNGALIEKMASIKPRKALMFIETPFCKEAKELPMDLKVLLMKDGIVALDSRKEASIALKEKKAVTRYANPSATGKFKLVNFDGTVNDADIVVFDGRGDCCEDVPCSCDIKCGSDMPGKNCLVVIDGKASYATTDKLTIDTEDIKDCDLGKEVTVGAIRSCLPVREWKENVFEQPGYVVIYDKAHDTAYKGQLATEGNDITFRIGYGSPTMRLVLTGKPGTLFTEAGVMYIPSTARLVDLSSYERNDRANYRSIQSAVNDTLVNGGYETVKVASDGSMWRIDDKTGGLKGFVTYNEGYKYLVGTIGLRAKQASDILADAKADCRFGRIGNGISFWVKRASFDPADDPWKGVGNDVYETREAGLRQTGPLDDKALKRIDDASRTDVKELFDTQVMTELAKTAYSVDKAQDYLPYLVRALDRICRTLIMFYWHNDDFEERYGKQNIPQLEDALKDNIQSLGGLISYIKDKTVQDDELEDNEDDLQQEMA